MASRGIKALAVTAIAALAFTGCARPPAAMGSVNGVSISAADLDNTARGCVAAVEQTTGQKLILAEERPAIATWLVIGEMGRQLESQLDLQVSERDIEIMRNRQPLNAALRSDAHCDAAVQDLARFQVLASMLQGSEAFQQYVQSADIVLNPRYGVWSQQDGQVVGVPSGALAKPHLS